MAKMEETVKVKKLMPVLVEWSGPGWYDHSSIRLSRKWGDDVLVYTSSTERTDPPDPWWDRFDSELRLWIDDVEVLDIDWVVDTK